MAIIVSKLTAGHVSPLLWFSGVMVLVLGGLTIWLHDETFIKIKPTIYYVMVAGILFFGLRDQAADAEAGARRRLSGPDRARLDAAVAQLGACSSSRWRWRTRRSGAPPRTDFWLGYKLWGAMPATFLFALANIPMLMKHGLNAEAEAKEARRCRRWGEGCVARPEWSTGVR